MRKLLMGTAIGGLVFALGTLACGCGDDNATGVEPDTATPNAGTAEANVGTITTIAIDMDPSAAPANDEDTVGSIEACIEVSTSPPTVFEVDVVTDAIPLAVRDGLVSGFQYVMQFPDSVVTITGVDHSTAGTVLVHRNPGGWSLWEFTQGSTPPPYNVSPLVVAMSDISATGIEGNGESPPNSAGGVLGRYTFTVNADAPPGVYALTLTNVGYAGPEGPLFDDPTGDEAGVDNDDDGGVDEDILLDGNATPAHGLIAVDVDCGTPMASPTPGATSSPSPGPPSSPSPGPPSSPTATPPPTTVYLVNGWNLSCYVGAAQPIENALADVLDHVLAIYRLSSDQAFEGWFPNRPEVSTISTFSPYDSLFILMTDDATWVHEPSDTPPASASVAAGWNSVCYAGSPKDIGAATAAIEGKFAVVYALGSDQSWQRFVPGRPEVSNLTQLNALTAVLMLVTDESGAVWVFDP